MKTRTLITTETLHRGFDAGINEHVTDEETTERELADDEIVLTKEQIIAALCRKSGFMCWDILDIDAALDELFGESK